MLDAEGGDIAPLLRGLGTKLKHKQDDVSVVGKRPLHTCSRTGLIPGPRDKCFHAFNFIRPMKSRLPNGTPL